MTQAGKRASDFAAHAAAKGDASVNSSVELKLTGADGADNYVVQRHPAGDRYIVTARSTHAASPSLSRASNTTPRPVASAGPYAKPPTYYNGRPFAGKTPRQRNEQRRDEFRRKEQDEQYFQYYSSWKYIATSKTEKEADEILMSAIQRSPMGRYCDSPQMDVHGVMRGRQGFLTQALEGIGRQQPHHSVPKPQTLQDKRRKQLERMKQTWGIVDQSVSKHSDQSIEEFFDQGAPSARAGDDVSAGAQHAGMRTAVRKNGRGGGVGARYGAATHAKACVSSPSPRSWAVTPAHTTRHDRSGSSRGLAEEARSALATLGIQRPPSTARKSTCVTGGCAMSVSSPSRPESNWGVSGVSPREEAEARYHTTLQDKQVSFSDREGGGRRRSVRVAPPPVDVGMVEEGREAGGAELTGSGIHELGGVLETPTRVGALGRGKEDIGKSPGSDGAWDVELEDLLKWTESLSPVAEK